ncbi:hypothetical protein COB72_02245 [bacterium]|nr:MAG: hypothetical protein COB72_02245 [bacterium]
MHKPFRISDPNGSIRETGLEPATFWSQTRDTKKASADTNSICDNGQNSGRTLAAFVGHNQAETGTNNAYQDSCIKRIAEAWPSLPPAIQDAILAIVDSHHKSGI